MSISFNEELAAEYGLNVIIFCSKIADWLKWNKVYEQNFYDGKYWTYNTLKGLTLLFPFWTLEQIRKVIKDSISAGLIVRGNYNKKGYDQTLWYTLTDLGCEAFKILMCGIPHMDVVKTTNGCVEFHTPIPIQSTNTINQSFKHKEKSFFLSKGKTVDKAPLTENQEAVTQKKKANKEKHAFAESMDAMANEKRHIEEHEALKRAPMPDGLRQLCQTLIKH